ncbi:uncharacterized protein LOC134777158 [Penaeus indicus]|uniref:uncharacterized protein LOC134777158 n=1 Tax=Penaeus indicus TaxID=29960 RepID=UPI00300D065E
MKRVRNQIPEEEPLSKRINNLHLDNSSGLLTATPPSLVVPTTSHNLPAQPCDSGRPTNLPNVPLHNGLTNGVLNSGMNGAGQDVGDVHEIDRLATEILNRDMPESLSIAYPNMNPTENNQYFSFNKLLHDLHIERLRRLGKLPLGSL